MADRPFKNTFKEEKMKIFCLILAVVLLFDASISLKAQDRRLDKNVVTYNSFGRLKIGMTVPVASKALGVQLIRDGTYPGNDCYYVNPRGFKNVSFMVTSGRISRIDVGRTLSTDRGAKVGDSEAKIKSLYKGKIKVSEHPYLREGHYLEVKFNSGKYSIIFETDGKRVTSFRAGYSEEVNYIEGCA